MAHLIGLVVVGLMGIFNLLLAYGLVRRTRDHAELLARLSDVAGGRSSAGAIADVGTRVSTFRSRTEDGEVVDRDRLSAWTLVGFFSTGCS
ncbi:hypothetical protein, partial [Umezawaea sp. NPDC059074]|uniref:hypothetical protein n=1 Tax=Umezawaea sp. NPDC059074 TaxID=3346716 RepID=UPI00369ACD0C